jgi:hypothetical protein
MPKRLSKDAERNPSVQDVNEIAARITEMIAQERQGKNPYAVALGRLGGKKSGKARMEKLSARKRSEIARQAARARWAKRIPK